MTRRELAAMIDHTLLKPDASQQQIQAAVLYAMEAGAYGVCLNSCWAELATSLLDGSAVQLCCAVGFPFGAATSYAKAKETEAAWQDGAQEIDMVMNIGALKSGDYDFVTKDIEMVVKASPAPVKVILETCYLKDAEIEVACRLAAEAGAAFVRTSTGFGVYGAKVSDVKLMRKSIPDTMQVKASAGITDLADALVMIEAGATRIGASRTAAILGEMRDDDA